MDERSKREIKQLVRGFQDPRTIFSPRFQLMTMLGYHAIVISIVISGLPSEYLISVILMSGFYVVFTFWKAHKEKQLKLLVGHNSFASCLWCRYPLTGLPDRGICTECGNGYDKNATIALYKERYQPLDPPPLDHIIYTRRTRRGARAIRERDRQQIQSSTTT
ncbi:MAG: hypothetical protein ACWA5W_02770 [Phycisphaerales bacterium]